MRVTLCNQNKITKLNLPNKVEGSFWLVDEFTGNNIVSVEASLGKWIISDNSDAKLKLNNQYVSKVEVVANSYCFIEYGGFNLFIYFENSYDNSYSHYAIAPGTSLNVGRDANYDIVYNDLITNDYFSLNYDQNGWIVNINNGSCVYINGSLMNVYSKRLNYGDSLFCYGLRMVFSFGIVSINNPANKVSLNIQKLSNVDLKRMALNNTPGNPIVSSDEIKEIDYYKEEDYFFKKARIRRFIETYDLKVTPPPAKEKNKDTPLLLVLGPMLTMALVSCMRVSNVIVKIMSGESTWKQSSMSLVSSGAMLLTSLLWPNLTKVYQKKVSKKKEETRQKKYRAYISRKKEEILEVVKTQTQILNDTLLSPADCENIILEKKINLWERRSDQKDFLMVRLGIGNVPIDMKINFSEQDFTLEEEDNLRKEIEETIEVSRMLYNVPVGYSFNNKKVTALMGADSTIYTFTENVLLQLLTFHSYDDLKIIFLVNKKHLDIWEKFKGVPHVFNNSKRNRFFASNMEDAKVVSSFLEQELMTRLSNLNQESVENEVKEKTFTPYYLIITDDYPMYRKLGIVENILNIRENVGFGMVCVENQLRRLPSECINFIYVDKTSTLLCTDIDNYSQQQFNEEINYNIRLDECCKKLANTPIEFTEDIRSLPTALGFLEMYNVGKIEQLNLLNRWRLNNPIQSLRAQIGINDESNPIYLDLHEKFHGPHGLIAGTTGSGKSEFIITYILSMAVNYSPNEVAFILIDYKGGGLAGAFENKTQGLRLPHLAGTITNLDKASLNRTLVSIDSELKRRQQKFNEVRDKLGESTIDIYKYQRFFREKKITEPMPHLFIISDEFAELKAQQPEFMDDLISAARIGRSLGVHLILATQKPSGVVNDQIWSNTKFRVCLKVQDKGDSNEMLKMPDAAFITNAGRFFLQVGNNEILVLGQSGWAGTQYVASDVVKKKYDRSISFIDDVGNVYKNLEELNAVKKVASSGDELSNVLKYICKLATTEKVSAKNLWLDSIPDVIYVDDIINKYKFQTPDVVTAVLGEYDAPSKQYQNILTLNLDEDANTLIFGASGTNREMFIASFIYSVSANYTAEDVNIYLVDYGSEALRMYGKFPQVGDIVYASEEDKLSKLLTMINDEISIRKKLFADYNGEYKTYCKNSGKKVPLKVIIINNYDSFKESHANLEETFVKFTREGGRYGIIFIISALNTRSIYSKVKRNFSHTFVLDMTDRTEYIDILGKIGNVYPAEYDGRGIFKEDEAYEFQTAQVCNIDKLLEFINSKVEQIKAKSSVIAPNIPCLPDVVTIDEHLVPQMNNINALPIGINKNSLKVCTYNFFSDKANILTSKKLDNCIGLLKTIITGVRRLNHMTVLIDTEQQLSSIGGMVNTYVDKNFEEFILRFENFLDKEIDGKNVKVLCIISGLEKFQGSLNEKKFQGFFGGIKTLENINLLFVDPSHKLKKFGYENWYSKTVNNINGIWIGSGFMEQTVINCSDYTNKYKVAIDNQFAWVSKNGEAELVKIVTEKVDEDEE